ncbi:MAG: class I SAM-dependent methyltransferase [Hydrogenobacter sp.]|uniref:class I SAM-dependent methyltransferase n=1 Tax=Hydrogenobacter thermophilus TaxID=940 RepID=UPI0030F7AC0B
MKVFDDYAFKYDEWYEKPFGKSAYSLELECLKNLHIQVDSSLEIGVGSGRFASMLGIKYGVDTSKRLLKIALTRGVRSIVAKAESLPFKDMVFDEALIVVSLCFFEDPTASLREAHRILKDRGILLLGLVLSESPWADFYKEKAKKGHPIYTHAKFYSYPQLITMLKSVGFKLDRIYTTLFEDPQDEKPIENRKILDGFHPKGGFFCVRALKLSL